MREVKMEEHEMTLPCNGSTYTAVPKHLVRKILRKDAILIVVRFVHGQFRVEQVQKVDPAIETRVSMLL